MAALPLTVHCCRLAGVESRRRRHLTLPAYPSPTTCRSAFTFSSTTGWLGTIIPDGVTSIYTFCYIGVP